MAKDNRRYQITGDQKPLGNTPVGSPSADPRSGKFQMTGTCVGMSNRPIPSPSANPGEGRRQLIGDEIRLSRTPVKGWGDAADLAMSRATFVASNNPVAKKGNSKRR